MHAFLYVSYIIISNVGFCLIYSHTDLVLYLLHTIEVCHLGRAGWVMGIDEKNFMKCVLIIERLQQ